MNWIEVIFFVFALLSIGGAIWLLTTKDILYAALGLLAALISTAAFFAISGADFLAVAQIVVYVGGVLILLLFGIMFTHKQQSNEVKKAYHHNLGLGLFFSTGIAGLFIFFILKTDFNKSLLIKQNITITNATTKTIGKELMTSHIFPFELAGFLLLVALIAATFIASKQDK